jgi:HK97 family phage major capsid protein
MGTNGAAITVDTAADLMGLVDDANAFGAIGFLTNSKVKKAAAKLKDSQNRPYGIAEVFKQSPVVFSNQVPNNLTKGTGTNLSAILYGVWSDLVIAYWSAVDIVINPYADSVAAKGGALIHAFLDADVALRHPESFAAVKDAVA